ncbi:SH3 domain-binding protein 5 homolog isoform X2 [Gordionus sp. m RMFG-2023]|uniref:SH3 domain-binding protein 5 homolog isoform X2 n=1 Tax=Gordionus sp. m RMFG-2023 TaxID=3053472 RepID=UPI0031FCD0A9
MSGLSVLTEDEIETEELDPRIPIELERLNNLSTEINELEKRTDEANETFRAILSQSAVQLRLLAAETGPKSIDKARPYYEALQKAREAQKRTQLAALEFQRANGIHAAAKETIRLAEAKFGECQDSRFDAAWQEMLNHATVKVNESEAHKLESEQRHKSTALEFSRIDRLVTFFENTLGRSLLTKTLPYFEVKDKYNNLLELQKDRILTLQREVALRKETYRGSLKTLENISEEIHQKRISAESVKNGNQVITSYPIKLDEEVYIAQTHHYPLLQDCSQEINNANFPARYNTDDRGRFKKLAKRSSLEELDRQIEKAANSSIIVSYEESSQENPITRPRSNSHSSKLMMLKHGKTLKEHEMESLIENKSSWTGLICHSTQG